VNGKDYKVSHRFSTIPCTVSWICQDTLRRMVFLSAGLVVSLVLARSPNALGKEDKPPRDVWMVIEGLEFFSTLPGAQVRVVANVNGTEFIYPSVGGVEWLEVGPSMSSQVFHLLPAQERYIVRFEAAIRVPAEAGRPGITGRLTSVKEAIVNVDSGFPFVDKYILHTFDPVHMSRGASAQAVLNYRLTCDPK
jgi:hypothetical protein